MGLPPSGIVTVRLAPRDADAIDAIVEEGEFTNRSDFIRYAVKAALADLRRKADEGAFTDPLAGPGALHEPAAADRRGARRAPRGVHHDRG